MSVTPLGRSVQATYRDYREGNLLVNRRYQRKLVWSVDEKRALVDSILKGYPIPLFLLAERPGAHGRGKYEIIDGIQRLNAIFSFIENAFDLAGSFFDVNQFLTAKQAVDEGRFTQANGPFLSAADCARILDYQLAVTIYPANDEQAVTTVFGRVNSGGRQLSPQERRQAGVTSQFSNLIRTLAADLRGDVSKDVLLLSEMPQISVESARETVGYGIRAEDTFWCQQGILSIPQLRASEDEQFLADIAASILLEKPLAVSQEKLDLLYDNATAEGHDLETRLLSYGSDRLSFEIRCVFSVLRQVIAACSNRQNFLRDHLRPGGRYPLKVPFYALFMAFFDLVVSQRKSPDDAQRLMTTLKGLSPKLKKGAHYETTENRVHNINITKGLVQDSFIDKEPPVFKQGPGLAIDFENALRRSRIETPRYEKKQGVLRLDQQRTIDTDLLRRLVDTVCGIANVGPDGTGFVMVGVADKEPDATRIAQLDHVEPKEIAGHYVVGIDREAEVLQDTLDNYIRRIVEAFRSSALSDPLKTQVLSSFDTITLY